MEDEDPLRFKEARSGDHLMCSFQCDACHFMNMNQRPPLPNNLFDDLCLTCIRRANLDAFWSRERSTVAGNRTEGRRYLEICQSFGVIENQYPARGPFPVSDLAGMKIACAMLIRSLDPGKNTRTVQFETMRKLRSHLSNFSHTCPFGTGATFMGSDRALATVSNSLTNTEWFRRFMRGCHRRMGDVWLPDRPITRAELQRCMDLLEEDWSFYQNDAVGRANTGVTACVIITGFFGGLRGEEIVRTSLGAMLKHWDESVSYEGAPHVPLMLSGRFKQEVGEKLFTQPLAMEASSGVKIALWYRRTLEEFLRSRITTGPLFRNRKGGRCSVADLDTRFIPLLKRVQKRWPNVIPHDVVVENEYSCLRSLRRGSTAEAQNRAIPPDVIEANNRWRKHFRSKGTLPSMSMMERYTDAKANVPALIRYSGYL